MQDGTLFAAMLAACTVILIVASIIKANAKWYRCPRCGLFYDDMGNQSYVRPREIGNLPVEHVKCDRCKIL